VFCPSIQCPAIECSFSTRGGPGELDRVLGLGEPFLGELKLVLELVEGFLEELKLVLEIVEFFCLLVQKPCIYRSTCIGIKNTAQIVCTSVYSVQL
jgi:hypothetical protein